MYTLRDLKIGQLARVIKVHGDGPIKRRLMDMGISRGATLTIIKVAPLGDPIEISVRGYKLSLRKSDAASIEVEGITDTITNKS